MQKSKFRQYVVTTTQNSTRGRTIIDLPLVLFFLGGALQEHTTLADPSTRYAVML